MEKAMFMAMLIMVSGSVQAQNTSESGQTAFENMLKQATQNTFKLNGTCKLLMTPEGDQTHDCEPELINMAFASGNSSFIVTIKDKGGITFKGKDSAAVGNTASLSVSTILLTGTSFAPAIELKAKGRCTYTNPNAGPVHVECSAKTDRGTYQLSYESDGNWPPR